MRGRRRGECSDRKSCRRYKYRAGCRTPPPLAQDRHLRSKVFPGDTETSAPRNVARFLSNAESKHRKGIEDLGTEYSRRWTVFGGWITSALPQEHGRDKTLLPRLRCA